MTMLCLFLKNIYLLQLDGTTALPEQEEQGQGDQHCQFLIPFSFQNVKYHKYCFSSIHIITTLSTVHFLSPFLIPEKKNLLNPKLKFHWLFTTMLILTWSNPGASGGQYQTGTEQHLKNLVHVQRCRPNVWETVRAGRAEKWEGQRVEKKEQKGGVRAEGEEEAQVWSFTAPVFVWPRAPEVEQRIMGLRPMLLVMCRRGRRWPCLLPLSKKA